MNLFAYKKKSNLFVKSVALLTLFAFLTSTLLPSFANAKNVSPVEAYQLRNPTPSPISPFAIAAILAEKLAQNGLEWYLGLARKGHLKIGESEFFFAQSIREPQTREYLVLASIQQKNSRHHFVILLSPRKKTMRIVEKENELCDLLIGKKFEIEKGWKLEDISTHRDLWASFKVRARVAGKTVVFEEKEVFLNRFGRNPPVQPIFFTGTEYENLRSKLGSTRKDRPFRILPILLLLTGVIVSYFHKESSSLFLPLMVGSQIFSSGSGKSRSDRDPSGLRMVPLLDAEGFARLVDLDGVKRLGVIGDVQSNFKETWALLEKSGFIDKKGKWIAGDSVLIFDGDLIDGGPSPWETLQFIYELQSDAEKKGGCVVVVRGNHEDLFLRWLEAKDTPTNRKFWNLWLHDNAGGGWGLKTLNDLLKIELPSIEYAMDQRDKLRESLYEKYPNFGEIVNWMKHFPYAARVNHGTLVVHGGPDFLADRFEDLANTPVSKEKITWEKGWTKDAHKVETFLKKLELDRIIYAHQVMTPLGSQKDQGKVREVLPNVFNICVFGRVAPLGGAQALLEIEFADRVDKNIKVVYGPNELGLENEVFHQRSMREHGPQDMPVQWDLGKNLIEKGEWSLAEEVFERIVQEFPTSSVSWMYLGMALHHQKNFAGAFYAYQRVLFLTPENESARSNYASALLSLDNVSGLDSVFNVIGKITVPSNALFNFQELDSTEVGSWMEEEDGRLKNLELDRADYSEKLKDMTQLIEDSSEPISLFLHIMEIEFAKEILRQRFLTFFQGYFAWKKKLFQVPFDAPLFSRAPEVLEYVLREYPELSLVFKHSLVERYPKLSLREDELKARLGQTIQKDPKTIEKIVQTLHNSSIPIADPALDWLLGLQIEATEKKERRIDETGPILQQELGYQGTPYNLIRDLVRMLDLKSSDLLYDLGFGYGRVLLYAALVTPAHFKGIELSHHRTQETLRVRDQLGLNNLELFCGNVLHYELGDGNIFFMFNPFGTFSRVEVVNRLRKIAKDKKIFIPAWGTDLTDYLTGTQFHWLKAVGKITYIFGIPLILYESFTENKQEDDVRQTQVPLTPRQEIVQELKFISKTLGEPLPDSLIKEDRILLVVAAGKFYSLLPAIKTVSESARLKEKEVEILLVTDKKGLELMPFKRQLFQAEIETVKMCVAFLPKRNERFYFQELLDRFPFVGCSLIVLESGQDWSFENVVKKVIYALLQTGKNGIAAVSLESLNNNEKSIQVLSCSQ